MNVIDLLIILFVFAALFRGRDLGFVRQFLSTIGFFSGLLLGALLQPYTVKLVHGNLAESLVTLATTLGCALIFMAIGEHFGIKLKERLVKADANKYDNIFGSVLAGLSLLIVVWLCANIIATLPTNSLQSPINNSKIVNFLDDHLPPAPGVIASLNRLIDPNGFPQVFTGREPVPDVSNVTPSLEGFDHAIDVAKLSVVKFEGQGCGGIVEGSGFVVGNGLVATNAHVIAGIKRPYVIDQKGTHQATPVWFDPNLDFAVVRTDGLAGGPLSFNVAEQKRGTNQAVLGYPGGGKLSVASAAILDRFTATGRNIYGEGQTARDVYEIKANIIPGNSGGPMLDKDGHVTGVIFAESTSYENVGYALTAKKAKAEVEAAKARDRQVSTGTCAN